MNRKYQSQCKQSKIDTKPKSQFGQCKDEEQKKEKKEISKPINQQQINERINQIKQREVSCLFIYIKTQETIKNPLNKLQKKQNSLRQIFEIQVQQNQQTIITYINHVFEILLSNVQSIMLEFFKQYYQSKRQVSFTRDISQLIYVIKSDFCKDFIDRCKQLSSEQSKKLSSLRQQNRIRSYSASKDQSCVDNYFNIKKKNTHEGQKQQREDNNIFLKLTQKKRLSITKKIPEKYCFLTRLLYLQKGLIILDSLINQFDDKITTQQNNLKRKNFYLAQLKTNKLQWAEWKDRIKTILSELIQTYEKDYGKYFSYYYLLSKVQLLNKKQYPIDPEEKKQIQNIKSLQRWLESKRILESQKNLAKTTIKNITEYESSINRLEAVSYRTLDRFMIFLQEHLKNYATYTGIIKFSTEKISSIKGEIHQLLTKEIQNIRQQKELAQRQYWGAFKQGEEDDVDKYYQQSD